MMLSLTNEMHFCQAPSIEAFTISLSYVCGWRRHQSGQEPPGTQCPLSAQHGVIPKMHNQPLWRKPAFSMHEGAGALHNWACLDGCFKANLQETDTLLEWKDEEKKHVLPKFPSEAPLYNNELHVPCKVLYVIRRGPVDTLTSPPMSRNTGRSNKHGNITKQYIMPMTVELM